MRTLKSLLNAIRNLFVTDVSKPASAPRRQSDSLPDSDLGEISVIPSPIKKSLGEKFEDFLAKNPFTKFLRRHWFMTGVIIFSLIATLAIVGLCIAFPPLTVLIGGALSFLSGISSIAGLTAAIGGLLFAGLTLAGAAIGLIGLGLKKGISLVFGEKFAEWLTNNSFTKFLSRHWFMTGVVTFSLIVALTAVGLCIAFPPLIPLIASASTALAFLGVISTPAAVAAIGGLVLSGLTLAGAAVGLVGLGLKKSISSVLDGYEKIRRVVIQLSSAENQRARTQQTLLNLDIKKILKQPASSTVDFTPKDEKSLPDLPKTDANKSLEIKPASSTVDSTPLKDGEKSSPDLHETDASKPLEKPAASSTVDSTPLKDGEKSSSDLHEASKRKPASSLEDNKKSSPDLSNVRRPLETIHASSPSQMRRNNSAPTIFSPPKSANDSSHSPTTEPTSTSPGVGR